MPKPMTHLDCFLSDDARKGRIWTDEAGYMYRNHGCILHVMETDGPDAGKWRDSLLQVAALKDNVTWADEPKTLTPQELFAMLCDRKCLATKNGAASPWALCYWDGRAWVSSGWTREHLSLAWKVVPDPSRQAEDDYHVIERLSKPLLKVGEKGGGK